MMMMDWAVDTMDLVTDVWKETNSWSADPATCDASEAAGCRSYTPALRCDLFSCSLLTRSDSNCSTEVLHSARHDDLSWTDDSRSCGSVLQKMVRIMQTMPLDSLYPFEVGRWVVSWSRCALSCSGAPSGECLRSECRLAHFIRG